MYIKYLDGLQTDHASKEADEFRRQPLVSEVIAKLDGEGPEKE